MPVLGVAAVVFTGGAALGLTGPLFAGGFGGAVASGVASLGLTGTVGTALTGALTYAGYGAAAGALTSAVTGGKPLKGAIEGGAAGLALGGAAGAFAPQTFGITGIGKGAVPSSVNITPQTFGTQARMAGTAAKSFSPGMFASAPVETATLPPITGSPAPVIGPGASAAPSTGGFGNLARSITSPEFLGPVAMGVGNAFGAQADADAALQAGRDQRNFYSQNYNTGGGGLFTQNPMPSPNTARRAPSSAFPNASGGDVGRIEYDPQARKIVFIPPSGNVG